jgi:hypothetical protein
MKKEFPLLVSYQMLLVVTGAEQGEQAASAERRTMITIRAIGSVSGNAVRLSIYFQEHVCVIRSW